MPPSWWLARAARTVVAVYALAGAGVLGLIQRAREGARVPRGAVTGRAAAAVGDSAAFAVPGPPPGVRPTIARADAESAAVAFGYRLAPSDWVPRGQHFEERPFERRRLCGRTYYVQPVVALPDSAAVPAVTADPVLSFGPAWVVPVCDAGGLARTTVLIADAPTRLRVVLGDGPGAVPELVYPTNGYAHIGGMDPWLFRDWDRGIALTPEAAVAVAAARLAGTGARVAEVPEAFMIVAPPPRGPQARLVGSQTIHQAHACPRWRLTLDRAVVLRGARSGQTVRTRIVYVARGDSGCDGEPALLIPERSQPTTLPFQYGVLTREPAAEAPARGPRSAAPPPPELRWTALRVTEPIWFEGARLATGDGRRERRAPDTAGESAGTARR